MGEPTQATITDVARAANVSISTVSRYMSGKPIRDSAKVQDAIEACNFVPRRYARSLRLGRSDTVAVIVPDLTNPYFAALMVGVEEITRQADLRLIWVNSSESKAIEHEALTALLGYVDGLIIAPVSETDDLPRTAQNAGVKVVLVDRLIAHAESFDWVVVDNIGGSELAATHFLASGHEQVGLIAGPLDSTPGRERAEGFLNTLANAGINVKKNHIKVANFREAGGYIAMNDLLQEAKPPTAVFSCNNLMTIGALRKLNESKIALPDTMSIIGFDDFPLADIVTPAITVISRPAEEQGRKAAEIMIARLRQDTNPTGSIHFKLPTNIIVRSSVSKRN